MGIAPQEMMPNHPHSVEAPITPVFHTGGVGRHATDELHFGPD
jgi:hypothetical protein